MAIAEADLDSKVDRAFRLLRGEIEQPGCLPDQGEPLAPPEPEQTYESVQLGREIFVDPKWGRVCLDCKEAKPWDEFHLDQSRKTGRRSKCGICTQKRANAARRKAAMKRKEAAAAVEQVSHTEAEARTEALERLAEMYPTKFAQFLYSEQVRLGVRKVRDEPRVTGGLGHRSWASTRS